MASRQSNSDVKAGAMQVRWVLLLLCVSSLMVFFRIVVQPDGFIYRPNSGVSDLTITHWPNALFVRNTLTAWRQLPLWRPLILSGEPFAANPLSGIWYPPNLLLIVFPVTMAFNLLFVAHAVWSGLGAFRLARSTGASDAGGILASLTVMLAPKAIAHLASGHVGLYFAWSWLPWLLWSVRRLAQRSSPPRVAVTAVVGASLILADVRLGFYGALAAGAYWIWLVTDRVRSRSTRLAWAIVAVMAVCALVAGLVAVQMLPLAAAAGRMNRGGLSLEESGIASLPPRYLLGLIIGDHGGFQEWMTYMGAGILLLAAAGVARWAGSERWVWTGVALGAGIYSLGTHTPIYGWLYRVLPPLTWLRGPARAWFLVVIGVALLAAHGTTVLEAARGVRCRRTQLAAFGLAVAACVGGVGSFVFGLPANVMAACILWPLGGVLILLRLSGALKSLPFATLVVALSFTDLCVIDLSLYRVRSSGDVLSEGRAAAEWLAQQPRPFRVYSPSYSIPQHTGALYGIESVDGVDPFQLTHYVEFVRAATRIDIPGYGVTVPAFPDVPQHVDMLQAHADVLPDLRLLGLLNVRYLATGYPLISDDLVLVGEHDDVHVYRNERALPRAFIVDASAAGVHGSISSTCSEIHPDTLGVLEDRAMLRSVSSLRLTPNRIDLTATGPGLLVLSEIWDPDWAVEVDGLSTPLLCYGGVLRAVWLDPGTHRVQLTYWPGGLSAGITATLATVIGVVVLCWMRRWSVVDGMGELEGHNRRVPRGQ
ncbi:MAG: hypothetical protein GX620_09570 [Chloroflexi bacterium]|nr:hypothetical protein [Chloroflexota bacterium]